MNDSSSRSSQQRPHPLPRPHALSFSPIGQLLNKAKEFKVDRMLLKDASLVFGYLLAGWSDASPGSLLPAIQEHYQINFIVVSVIFLCNLCGWILAAILTPVSLDRLGFGPTLTLAASICVIQPILVLPLPPFPLLAFSYILSGLSIGSQDALANSFMSARPRPNLRLASLHFTYGIGALCAPLAAAAFLKGGLEFSRFYSVGLVLAVLNTIFLTLVFRFEKKDGLRNEDASEQSNDGFQLEDSNRNPSGINNSDPLHPNDEIRHRNTPQNTESQSPSRPQQAQDFSKTSTKFKTILSQSNVWFLSIFALLYVGTEVSIGGWSSTYIIQVRGSAKDSNYIVSGFWSGIALGRIFFIPVTAWLGDSLAVLIYLSLAIGFQFVVWLVPSLVANAISLAVMGLLIGPIFPIMISVATLKIRPRILHPSALGFIVSFGSAGSALFPLLVGLIAQSKGIKILAPILLVLLCAQLLAWLMLGVPKRRGRDEDGDRID